MSPSLIFIANLLLFSHLTSAEVLLIEKNKTISFEDVQANFTPVIKKSDQRGVLYVADPLVACSELTNTVTVEKRSTVSSPYVLISRGGCSFEEKIRNAQKAGYKAAVVYDNDAYGLLVSMSGNPSGVHIYGTFVSKATGEVLKEYVGRTDIELWLIPSFETSVWSIMAVSFISLLAMSAVLATCFFVRRHRVRRLRFQSVIDFPHMSKGSIRRLPITIFNGVCDERTTSVTCAICTYSYCLGDKLRILPCHHKFHARCVDVWLLTQRSCCPFCRADARTISHVSERTPLLSPSLTPTSSFLSSSPFTTPTQSSYDLSVFIRQESPSTSTSMHPQTVPMHLSHSRSRSHTSFRKGSLQCSSSIPVSQSSVDLRNAISRRSYYSPCHGSLRRSLQSRYTHILSPGYASRSWREHSHKSISHYASASSLPDC